MLTRALLPSRPRSPDIMAMPSVQSVTTIEELVALPNDGMRHELLAGELRTMAPSGRRMSIAQAPPAM